MAGGYDPKNLPTKPVDPVAGPSPSAREVQKFHINDDVDGSDGSHHHTLGPRKGQSAPGDHDHRGGNSVLLLDGVTIAGARGGNTALASVIAVLVELGATDTTTP